MRIVVTLCLCAIATSSAVGQPAADVSGTWDLVMTWEGAGSSTGVCTFEQDGDRLTGHCGGTDRFPIAGRVENGQVSWQMEVSQDGADGRMAFAGALSPEDGTIAGVCTVMDGPRGTFTLTRAR